MKIRNGIGFIKTKTNPNINFHDNVFLNYISYYIKYQAAETRTSECQIQMPSAQPLDNIQME